MSRSPLFVALLLLAVTGGSAAVAQEEVRSQGQGPEASDRHCADDMGNNRCAPEVQRAMRDLYGIADVETLSAQGVSLRRAMIVSGRGFDLIAITFSRAPGRSPTVEIATPRRSGEPASQSLATVIGKEIWSQVLAASRDFDQKLERELPGNRIPQDCLHSWFYVVEAVDADRMDQNAFAQKVAPATIRRDAEDACAGGLAARYASELARMAREQLRECGSHRGEDVGDDAIFLATCARLGGDRMAAGEADRFMEKFTGTMAEYRNFDRGELGSEFFAQSAKEIVKPFNKALKGGHIYVHSTRASDVDHATVEGRAEFWVENEGQAADMSLELVRQNGDFVVLSYKMSEKRRIR